MCTYGDVWDVIIDVTQRTVCHKRIGYATVERMVDGPYPRAVMLQLVTQQDAVLGIPSLLRHPQLAVHRLFNLHGLPVVRFAVFSEEVGQLGSYFVCSVVIGRCMGYAAAGILQGINGSDGAGGRVKTKAIDKHGREAWRERVWRGVEEEVG